MEIIIETALLSGVKLVRGSTSDLYMLKQSFVENWENYSSKGSYELEWTLVMSLTDCVFVGKLPHQNFVG